MTSFLFPSPNHFGAEEFPPGPEGPGDGSAAAASKFGRAAKAKAAQFLAPAVGVSSLNIRSSRIPRKSSASFVQAERGYGGLTAGPVMLSNLQQVGKSRSSQPRNYLYSPIELAAASGALAKIGHFFMGSAKAKIEDAQKHFEEIGGSQTGTDAEGNFEASLGGGPPQAVDLLKHIDKEVQAAVFKMKTVGVPFLKEAKVAAETAEEVLGREGDFNDMQLQLDRTAEKPRLDLENYVPELAVSQTAPELYPPVHYPQATTPSRTVCRVACHPGSVEAVEE